MPGYLEGLLKSMGEYVPNIVGAAAILVLGWLVALLVAAAVRALLKRTSLDNRAAQWIAGEEAARTVDLELAVSRGVFYILMLFVLVGSLQVLGLTLITEPINRFLTVILEFAPSLVGAAILLLVAWVLANLLKLIITRVLSAAKIDERLGKQAGVEGEKPVPLTKSIANVVYWLVFLMFLPAVLGALAIEGLLTPVQKMMNQFLVFLPNIFAAGVILAIGWFAAKIVQRVASNLLAAVGVDALSERVGVARALGEQRLSRVIGFVLYVLVLVPVLIAALNALALEAITAPASKMLGALLAALPNVFAAALLLALAYLVGRVVSGLAASVLARVGFNGLMVKLGAAKESPEGERSPAAIAGYVVLVAIMLFAAMEACSLLGFEALTGLVAKFMVFAGHVLVGLVIFAIGLYLSGVVVKIVRASGSSLAGPLAFAARLAILLFAGAMALRHMGLANEIISLAFGLIVGAIAVAVAIAFGLGGREIAGRELQHWVDSIKSKRA